MSMSSSEKRSRGRPRTNPAAQHFTMPRDLSDALDAWISAQPEPRPSRPDAIRRLLARALGKSDAVATGAGDVDAIGDEAALPEIPDRESYDGSPV
jgi:hypothetical protein